MTATKVWSRADYMEGRCTHQEYYLEIAKALHLVCFPGLLQRVRKSKDPHLNDIPLAMWDGMGSALVRLRSTHNVFEARGDLSSRAGMVCALKALYSDAAGK